MHDDVINYEYLLSSLSSSPGYGLETTGRGPIHQPMAYGLVAWAAANRGDVDLARSATDWLVKNTDIEKTGWGLGWEWDAFADKTVNPAETVYGITTAIAVEGLVSTYCLTREKRYLNSAIDALDYYAQFQCPQSGHFHYSDQPEDSVYQVPNITAMLMGQYARLGHVSNNHKYVEIAKKAYEAMIVNSQMAADSLAWKYIHGVESERGNDLVHSCYAVYGLYLYESYAYDHQSLTPLAARYLLGFIEDDVYEFNIDRSSDMGDRKARSWGVGMLLYVLSLTKENQFFETALSHLRKYVIVQPLFQRKPFFLKKTLHSK